MFASDVSRRAVLLAGVATAAASVLKGCRPAFTNDRQASGPPARSGGAVALAIVDILTADLNRSLRFYRLLGLNLPESVDGDSYRLQLAVNHVLYWETPSVIHTFDPSWSLPQPGNRRIVLASIVHGF